MIDLPTIVEAIRKQRPGVVPEWLKVCDTYPVTFREVVDDELSLSLSSRAVQAIIEAALWRAYMTALNSLLIDWDGRPGQPGVVGWYTDSIRRGRTIHGTGKFALVRALCHAIGIKLDDA